MNHLWNAWVEPFKKSVHNFQQQQKIYTDTKYVIPYFLIPRIVVKKNLCLH